MAIWRDCVTEQINTSVIPDKYMETIYTGSEGGTCWEEIPVTFSSSSVNFSKINYTATNPLPVTIKAENKSTTQTYRLQIQSDPVFVITPAQIELLPSQSAQFTVAIPTQNLSNFKVGKTEMRLQITFTKL